LISYVKTNVMILPYIILGVVFIGWGMVFFDQYNKNK